MNGEIITEKSQENHTANSKRTAKDMVVSLLDDTEYKFDVEPKSKGEELLKKVNSHLNLDESEFFGLLFVGRDSIQYWLDPQKSINKQIKDLAKAKFKFRVMYYTPDPNSLQEYTRYLFTLQVRRDLLDGRLWCTEETGALLASYIVQGELGNYDPVKHAEGYLKGFNFVPNQTPEIEQKIVDYHISHRGKNPADSDHQMLDIARKLEMYGITLYSSIDSYGREVDLAMHHMGIMVFQNKERIQNYTWANLRKLSFKKKKVLLKLRSQTSKDVISFTMKNRNAAKNFWKICVNHHVFFKAQTAPENKAAAPFKKGSKYRYSGRTKQQITEAAAKIRSRSEYENEMSQSGGDSFHIPSHSHSDASESINQNKPSEDEGTHSIDSATIFSKDNRVEDLAEDNFIPTVLQQQNIITMKHPSTNDTDDTTYTVVETQDTTDNDDVFSDKHKVSLMDKLKMTENSYDDDNLLDLKINVASTDQEIEDENDFSRLNTFNGHDFSLEVESMFQKINSEYGNSQSGWQYNITSITSSEHEDDGKEEGSETEDSRQDRSEFTEVDANHFDLNGNNQKQCSDKTEADEETEIQMKQRVKGLTYPVYTY